jgi:serine/threonine-protein kinase
MLFLAWPAHADDADVAAAEALFQDGRALLEAGRASEACPKLAESQRLDPATGTLIALAACHELEGKLATAWAEFTEASGRAQRESRSDRYELASQRAEQLRPRLSWLSLEIPPSYRSVERLEIRRAGRSLGRDTWSVPVPVDGGEFAIEVAAPGYKPWRSSVVVAPEGDRKVVRLPELEPELKPALAPPRAVGPLRQEPKPVAPPPDITRWGTYEWVGIGSAAAGVLTLGAGAYFLSEALSNNKRSNEYCTGNACDPDGISLRNEALRDGRWATGFAIGGGSLVAAGTVLFFVGRNRASHQPPVAVTLSTKALSATVMGEF